MSTVELWYKEESGGDLDEHGHRPAAEQPEPSPAGRRAVEPGPTLIRSRAKDVAGNYETDLPASGDDYPQLRYEPTQRVSVYARRRFVPAGRLRYPRRRAAGGDMVEWFTDSCDGVAVPGGISPTVNPTTTTIYYARSKNTMTGCVSTTCCSVTVTSER